MFVGHFAAALTAKRIEPRLSLGTLVFAAMLADLLWCAFLLAGVEHVQYTAGLGAANYLSVFDVPFSHSLAANIVWAALLAVAWFGRRRFPRGALILFAVVLSHWLLDLISDKGLQLAPGLNARVGFLMWKSIPATLLVEGGFWLIAIILYVRATRARGLAGVLTFWIVAALITLLWYNNIAGPPPPDPRTAPIGALILFSLLIAWAYWVDRLRPALASSAVSTRS